MKDGTKAHRETLQVRPGMTQRVGVEPETAEDAAARRAGVRAARAILARIEAKRAMSPTTTGA